LEKEKKIFSASCGEGNHRSEYPRTCSDNQELKSHEDIENIDETIMVVVEAEAEGEPAGQWTPISTSSCASSVDDE
jgi:hypothetical protein